MASRGTGFPLHQPPLRVFVGGTENRHRCTFSHRELKGQHHEEIAGGFQDEEETLLQPEDGWCGLGFVPSCVTMRQCCVSWLFSLQLLHTSMSPHATDYLTPME